ncbi:hypothetical protein Pla163_11300 [Planctomycetes bacterium Pla163]|uniref:RiboL-PSP-HEPN domain-containing protein n=1 Tax=Rohdeia mirabilis TaxID=2528008 RepID=A0A518CXS9_9BACT|nr:hypothetical protein Pla163_11300 [Planctomycetes bacterium Pla163]
MEREVKTYRILLRAAELEVKRAQEEEEGTFFMRIHTILLLAFAVEAHMNHVGLSREPDWNDVERTKYRTQVSKRSAYLEWAGIDESDDRVVQLIRLFECRDQLAHGKTVTLNLDGDGPRFEMAGIAFPSQDWEQVASSPSELGAIWECCVSLMGDAHQRVFDAALAAGAPWSAHGYV